ncbi:MAG: hypothetical protein WCR51_11065 [Planctomycetia bacterium]
MAANGPQGGGGRAWPRVLAGMAAGLAGGIVVVTLLLKHEPAIVATAAGGPDAERAAARLVTIGSALHAAVGRAGPWGAALSDTELNAWLATDLPRNHPHVLPRGLSAPRVRFRSQHVEAVVRAGSGLLSVVVWCDLEVTLRGVNQLGIVVEKAAVGAVPLPATPVLAELGRRLAALGCVTELRPRDGRTVLVVYIPTTLGGGPQWRLESLRIDAGEFVVAGTTIVPGDDAAAAPAE